MVNYLFKWLFTKHGFISGIVIALAGQFPYGLYQDWHDCRVLVRSFRADIEAMKAKHAERLETWPDIMNRLRKYEKATNDKGRPWLMPEAAESSRTVVFDSNTAKLGSLDPALAEQLARFYAKTEMLSAQVRVLASPPMISASGGDVAWLTEKNDRTYEDWKTAAGNLLDNLKQKQCKWLNG